MNSKEKFINGSLTSIEYINELIKTCDSDHKKYLKQVKKDLEILEIIKDHIELGHEEDDFPDFYIMFYGIEKKECNKLKKWVKENE